MLALMGSPYFTQRNVLQVSSYCHTEQDFLLIMTNNIAYILHVYIHYLLKERHLSFSTLLATVSYVTKNMDMITALQHSDFNF